MTTTADRIPPWMKLPVLWVVMPLGLLAVIFVFAASALPAWKAALGDGTRGQYTVLACQQPRVWSRTSGCGWVGEFVGVGGTDRREDVGIESGSHITHVGQTVAAIDTGGVEVYSGDIGSAILLYTAVVVLALIALLLWVLAMPLRKLRPRRPRVPSAAGQSSAAPRVRLK